MPLSSRVIEHRSFPGPSSDGEEILQESKEHRAAPNPCLKKVSCGPGYSIRHSWPREDEVARDHKT